MINDIPSCCKISLKGYDAPLTILISYLGGAFAGKHRDATDGGHSISDLKVFVSQKHTEPSPSANEGVYNNVSGFRLSLLNVAQENCHAYSCIEIVIQGERGSSSFAHQNLFLTFSSINGCQIAVTSIFSSKQALVLESTSYRLGKNGQEVRKHDWQIARVISWW